MNDFSNIIGLINILEFDSLLLQTGWHRVPYKKTYIHVFQKRSDKYLWQINLPVEKKDFSDYDGVLLKALKTYATAEHISLEEAVMIVLYPNADIINVRVNDEDIAAGIINFDTAVRIYEDTKKILTVTALDVIDPRPIHKGGKQVVTKFIESFKFGQTKVGSYIVPVICPLQEIDEREDKTAQLSLFSEESTLSNSFTRKVTTRFMDNLDKIRKCIEVSSEISFLTENNIGNIMSSNFLDVLLDFNNFGSSKSDISFKIYWSRKAEENRSEAIEVTLTKDINPILEAMSKKIKENVQPPDISIIGRIKELNAIPDIERREEGWAKIIYVDSQRSKTSKFKLDKSDYNLALDAHKRGLYVKVEGSIIDLEKKYYKALSFSVMEENCQDPVLF